MVMYFNIKDASQVSYIEMQEDLESLGGSDLNCSGVPMRMVIQYLKMLYHHSLFYYCKRMAWAVSIT